MKTSQLTAAALCLLLLTAGCLYEIRDEVLESETNLRNHRRAFATWRDCYPTYRSVENFHDFKCGFISGYKATAYGGNGCPPPLPPTEYWKGSYQTPEGKAKANTWFDGYAHGVLAAQSDGVAEMNQIVTRTPRPSSYSSSPMIPLPEIGPPAQLPAAELPPTQLPPSSAAEEMPPPALPSPTPPYEPYDPPPAENAGDIAVPPPPLDLTPSQ